jgi:muconolactone delta-isomerase
METDDMQFVIFGKPGKVFEGEPPADLWEVLEAEWTRSRELYAQGVLRHIWMMEGNRGVVAVYEADSLEHMRAINAEYPMVKAGYANHEIHGLTPYVGFTPERKA